MLEETGLCLCDTFPIVPVTALDFIDRDSAGDAEAVRYHYVIIDMVAQVDGSQGTGRGRPGGDASEITWKVRNSAHYIPLHLIYPVARLTQFWPEL